MMRNFKQVMMLAEFGLKRHDASTQRVFKMFVSYMTFLVVTAGLIMQSWKKDGPEPPDEWVFLVAIAMPVGMFGVYACWLSTAYRGMIYDLRRRDFYLKKAEVISYHLSKELGGKFDPIDVSLNLGSGNRYTTKEQCLFDKRAPDIENCLPKIPKGKDKPPCDVPELDCDKFFLFNLLFPGLLTVFNIAVLIYGLVTSGSAGG